MRDPVLYKMGGKEYPLLPTFAVVAEFEERFYGLLDHLERLMQGKATIQARSFLILQGLKAGDPDRDWDQNAVMERLFDMGYWHESVVLKEAEFIEKLLYTPEQYIAKKQEREQEAKSLQDAFAEL